MSTYLYIILGYLIILTALNFIRARRVKSQEDFMVAGRRLKTNVMVFTLICTWIGSGTFIAGAEFASKAGFSALWMAAGAWVGIILIYFLAGKIQTFGQYTIGDILEERYGPVARVFGAIALILSFTAIVSYQFVAGGFILNVATDGRIPDFWGTIIAASFVILFTAVGGMVAVAYTDLPNGVIIVLACLLSVPFVYSAAGGFPEATKVLDPGYFSVVNNQFGAHPVLKVGAYFLATMFLLMGVQSMYQKFYSARTPKDAKKAVILWTVGTVFVETVVVVIAVFSYSKFKGQLDLTIPKEGGKVVLMAARSLVPGPVGVLLLGAACAVVISTGMNYLLSPSTNIMRDVYQRFTKRESRAYVTVAGLVFGGVMGLLTFFLSKGFAVAIGAASSPGVIIQVVFAIAAALIGYMIVNKAETTDSSRGLFHIAFAILLGFLTFFAIKGFAQFIARSSEGKAYYGTLTTGIQILFALIAAALGYFLARRFHSRESFMVALQTVLIIFLGAVAYFLATRMTSVLDMAYFAYTIYGVAITPALIGALAWKRANKVGGLLSILLGTFACIGLRIIAEILPPEKAPDGDPWGIPLIYPALAISILALILGSLLTKKPRPEELEKFFPGKK